MLNRLVIVVSLGRKTPATAQRQIEAKIKARKRATLCKLQCDLSAKTLTVTVETHLTTDEMTVAINAALRRNKTTTAFVRECRIERKQIEATDTAVSVIASYAQQRPVNQFNGLRWALA